MLSLFECFPVVFVVCLKKDTSEASKLLILTYTQRFLWVFQDFLSLFEYFPVVFVVVVAVVLAVFEKVFD